MLRQVDEVGIVLRINYDAQTLEVSDLKGAFELLDERFRHKVRVDFQRVWQTSPATEGENQKRLEFYETCSLLGYNQREIANVFNIGLTHKCYTDRFYHAEFNYDGKVYRCTARDYSDKYVVGVLSEDGRVQWNEQEMARRYGKATFENKICLVCKYLPLCMGPCSQKMVETPEAEIDRVCYLHQAEVMPETVVLDYYHRKIKLLQS